MSIAKFPSITTGLKRHRAGAFVLVNHENSGQPNTRYLSGFTGSESIVLITPHRRFIITDGRYLSQARDETKSFEIIPTGKHGYMGVFADLVKRLRIRSILIDPSRTYYSFIVRLREQVPNLLIRHESDMLQRVRMIKTPAEIVLIKKSVRIALRAFEHLMPHIREGATERELADRLEFFMKEAGAERIAFDTICVSGKNGAFPHGKPTSKKIRKGELVTLDFGAVYQGYNSDITRTLAVGKISDKLSDIYDAVQKAQALGIKKTRAGITGHEIDAVCRDYIAERGYGKYFLHGTGHGLGLEVHELPIIAQESHTPLPFGAIITIEPGIYIEGLGGVRIEDDIVITKSGSIVLSK
ncbi:MAG: hypothetical protein A3A33_02690 [Candidatus Yanofskybacteria bacterium RIFCSPLOWO2_01_FULL_49_25]|uniref:Peptidase M24 domain-containing protein n=1 Tax=Candidatus Yanofskybacteria bacterium RIFCSPLOWO2_01_FULL_49_25 TaxID=1802701 RepID=A0A1F8GUX3_9BACT|nr:MAG: hypothetical protein A3A33_02690 [Candidatus Yanofskybacteria bacterium RIFCSPLOWO2_01_FULL_49_25]